jgi:hypothetical protein
MKLKLTVIISGLLALITTMTLTSTFPLAFAQEGGGGASGGCGTSGGGSSTGTGGGGGSGPVISQTTSHFF